MGFGVQFLLLLFNFLISTSTGKSNGVCISPGGRFPPFSSEGKPPRKVTRGPKDLTLCRVFRKNTCCDSTQTHQVLLSIRRLASLGEANPECLQLWELLECSICDPNIGVQPGPPLVCSSFCDRIFDSCANAYFSFDSKTHALSPCGVTDFVCGRMSEWVSNGTELCQHAGFAVKSSKDSFGCYGGKASLDSIADSWKNSRVAQKESVGVFDDFEEWVKEMSFGETVLWAVGGLVLTSGLLFISKRKSNIRRQKQAALMQTVRRVGSLVNNPSSPRAGSLVNKPSSPRTESLVNKPSSPTQVNRRATGR
ncbi:hypothetical protein ACHQM5_015211 [Ranunculus cassubicifolius]